MGKTIKFSLLGAMVGAGAAAAKAKAKGVPSSDDKASGDLPVKAAKGAGCGGLAGGLVGFGLDRRAKRKLKKRMKKSSVVGTAALLEAARMAGPAIGKKSRKAKKAAAQAAKQAGRKGRRARRKARYALEATRDSAGHLVDAGPWSSSWATPSRPIRSSTSPAPTARARPPAW